MAKIYLMARRKAWHHDVPDGWEEVAFGRYDYIECGIYVKPDDTLTPQDEDWVSAFSSVPEGWIDPTTEESEPDGDELFALVIAAREVAYDHAIQLAMGPERTAALDKALEAFAGRAPWDDEPTEGDQ